VLGEQVKEEEVVEGMEAGEEESEDEDEPEYDEHVWLSLKNAETLCNAITDALEEIDPANRDAYAANAASYLEKLAALDGKYQTVVDNAARKTVLFGDRFPFRYLVDDYGLSYYAAFVGCSAETEASFETISFLAGKVDELGLPCVLTIEGAQHKIAETIVQNSAAKNQSILTLNSMQSTTSADAVNGTTYLSVMESNLDVLKQALN
jgi:zinc transport system substrate-binding protein